MAKSTETGNNKNVVIFNLFKNAVATFGELYQPFREDLRISALESLYNSCSNAISAAESSEMAKHALIQELPPKMKLLQSYIPRIKSLIKASTASANTKEAAIKLASMITPKSTSAKKSVTAAVTEMPIGSESASTQSAEEHSVKSAHNESRSVDSQLENLSRLIKFLETMPQYAPSVPELTTGALLQMHQDISGLHIAIETAKRNHKQETTKRNELLYKQDTGMVSIATAVKEEIKGTFGAKSSQYKLISTFKFSKSTVL